VNYTEVGTYVEFILPSVYRQSLYQYYYVRVTYITIFKGNYSGYWKIGQTTVYDCTDPFDLIVNMDDVNVVLKNLTRTGANGWILADINNNGVINYVDIGGVCYYYPWDHSS
jgi:hypothetical protein